MRRASAFLAVVAALASCQRGDAPAGPPAPTTIVERFYETARASQVTGAPSAEQLAGLAPFLSDTLQQLLRAARVVHDADVQRAPDEKPSFAEGDLFSSLFEGSGRQEVGRVDSSVTPARIPVTMTYAAEGAPVSWTDTARVAREHDRWVIVDIAYGGVWDFGNKGSLRTMLEGALRSPP